MTQSGKEKGDKYESASRILLENLKGILKIESFEPGQGRVPIKGERSGEEWDADLIACKVDGSRIKIECRYSEKRSGAVKRADMASIAYEVEDTGAEGMVITNWPMQKGAENIAKAEQIGVIHFVPGKTDDEYIAEIRNILKKAMIVVGTGDSLSMSDEISIIVHNVKTGEKKEQK